MQKTLPLPKTSTTHLHLLRCVAALDTGHHRVLRILDLGFGDGRFLALCRDELPGLVGRDVELYGIDVHDERIQPTDFARAAHRRLGDSAQLHTIGTGQPWPFPSGAFDVVCSGQVGEHLFELEEVFREVARTLRPGGQSVHVFQLRDCIQEWHVGIPWAHRLRCHDSAVAYLRWAARLGLARVGPLRRPPDMTADAFAHSRADYLQFHTYYRTWPEVALAAKRAGLRASYRFTPDLYLLRLGRLVHRDLSACYLRPRSALANSVLFRLLKRASSVTVNLESVDSYQPPAGGAG